MSYEAGRGERRGGAEGGEGKRGGGEMRERGNVSSDKGIPLLNPIKECEY
jgi:hypothetical protein